MEGCPVCHEVMREVGGELFCEHCGMFYVKEGDKLYPILWN